MKVSLSTLGCKQNQYESDALLEILEGVGYKVKPAGKGADVCLINTCTVTAKADLESRQLIRRAIRENPDAMVVVTGCYAQVSPQVIAAIPGVDLVLGNSEKPHILSYLRGARKSPLPQVQVGDVSRLSSFDNLKVKHSHRTRAFLKVQDGCDYSCSFCIVPKARGRSRSQDPGVIMEQVRALAASGHQEIVLTGVHLGSYGRDLIPPISLTDLAEVLLIEPNLGRLRLSSLDPHEVDDGLVRLIQHSSRLCRHLHIPLQSGDDRILRLMRRAYSAKNFQKLVMDLTSAIPDLAIGADVIVGFPQETEEGFANTYSLLKGLPLAYLHVFSYSRRDGTEAAGMPGQIPSNIKAERSQALRELGKRKSLEFRNRFIGRTLWVVTLSTRDKERGLLRGLTDNYIEVLFAGDDSLMGRIVPVEITRVLGDTTFGRLAG